MKNLINISLEEAMYDIRFSNKVIGFPNYTQVLRGSFCKIWRNKEFIFPMFGVGHVYSTFFA